MTIGIQDILGVSPMILAVIAAVLVITLDIFLGRGDDREVMPMTSTGALIGVGVLLVMLWERSAESFTVLGDQMIVDRFGVLAATICSCSALATVLMAPRYLERAGIEHGEFYGLVLFALTGMMVMCMGQDLMMVFLGIETMSLAIYGLVGMNKSDPLGAEAATKYFVMGAIGSGFFTFGIALTYAASGTTSIPMLVENINYYWHDGASYLAYPGLGLMLVGFCFKIGAVPFHSWVPDVYQGAPTPVTGYMATGVKVAAAVVFARTIFGGFDFALIREAWSGILATVAAFSVVLGALIALVQRNLKRMLGYSAISHAGFILLAFLGDPIQGAAVMPLLVYLGGYAAAVAGVFAVLSQLTSGAEETTDLEHIQGLARQRPALAAALGLFMLSLAGIPGTAGFTGKLLVFVEAINGGWVMLALWAILMSLVSLGYYLPVIIAVYMREPTREHPVGDSNWGANLSVLLAAIATVAIGIYPQPFIDLAAHAAAQFHG